MEKLTLEDKIMGRTAPLPKTELELKVFSSETKYKVNSIGKGNSSIMVGSLVDRMLPLEIKQLIRNGEVVVEYNGIRIERLVEKETVVEEKVETKEETPKPKRKRVK